MNGNKSQRIPKWQSKMDNSDDKENEQEEQTEPMNVVEKTDEEDSESERGSEMSSSECEMSEETFRSINRIIEYVTVQLNEFCYH